MRSATMPIPYCSKYSTTCSCRLPSRSAGPPPVSWRPGWTHVDQDGVLLDTVQLVAQGRFLEGEMRELLTSGRYPVRNGEQNMADLLAQVAACTKGAQELDRMCKQFGLD